MPTPYNNPYVPGDPFSYDLKWIIAKLKEHGLILETLDTKILEMIQQLLDHHDPVYWNNADELVHSDMNTPSLAYIEGFYQAGDGGANLYYITSDYNDVLAANFYITLDGPNRWAIPVIVSPFVFPEMFGAYGDGTTDDTTAVQTCFLYKLPVYMAKKYLITNPLTIDYAANINCDGDIIFDGSGPAIIVSYSNVHLKIHELRSNSSGIEFRPDGNAINTNCQQDIIECDRILLTGSNGIALYLNNTNGLTQFCNFNINRLQGGYSLSTNTGIKIVTTNATNRYCNANKFNIHSLCFFTNGILGDTVANSCISNYFTDINFEQNTKAIDLGYAKYELRGCFDEPSAGKIVIKTGVTAQIYCNGILAENKIDYDPNETYSSHYAIFANFVNSSGVPLCDKLIITRHGWITENATTPLNASNLTNVFGNVIVLYVTDQDVIDVPSVRKGGTANYPLQSYIISFYTTSGSSGSFTLNFEDGTTKVINYTTSHGIVVVTPNGLNNGQWTHYLHQ